MDFVTHEDAPALHFIQHAGRQMIHDDANQLKEEPSSTQRISHEMEFVEEEGSESQLPVETSEANIQDTSRAL